LSPKVLDLARAGENGIAAYGMILLFACGVLISTLVYMPFTLAFPVSAVPAKLSDLFRAKLKSHILAILGGILFAAALLAQYVVMSSAAARQLGPALANGLPQAAPLLAILLGVLVWGEFNAATSSTKPLVWGGFFLYAMGVALIAFAPIYGAR
jgi:glucose uptake protein